MAAAAEAAAAVRGGGGAEGRGLKLSSVTASSHACRSSFDAAARFHLDPAPEPVKASVKWNLLPDSWISEIRQPSRGCVSSGGPVVPCEWHRILHVVVVVVTSHGN